MELNMILGIILIVVMIATPVACYLVERRWRSSWEQEELFFNDTGGGRHRYAKAEEEK